MSGERPLAGFTVAVTADRRREEFAALLERRGARTVTAPVLRIRPIGDDAALRDRTRALIAGPPDVAVVTTAIGLRGWLEAADGWDLAEPLCAALGRAYLVARGPKAKGAIRAAGLAEDWSPPGESCAEIVAHLVARGVAGRRVAVQLHGDDQPELADALRAVGADVVETRVYRWALPDDLAPARRLVDAVIDRQVDAVTFTSAPAVAALLDIAGDRVGALLDALRGDVTAASVGPVTSAGLRRMRVPVIEPTRARLGALARVLADELPVRRPTVRAAGCEIRLHAHAAILDGEARPLPAASMAVLRALVGAAGRVCSRAELLGALPRGTDEHAVEMAVTRLRSALGRPDLVQTIVKRGYRLRID